MTNLGYLAAFAVVTPSLVSLQGFLGITHLLAVRALKVPIRVLVYGLYADKKVFGQQER